MDETNEEKMKKITSLKQELYKTMYNVQCTMYRTWQWLYVLLYSHHRCKQKTVALWTNIADYYKTYKQSKKASAVSEKQFWFSFKSKVVCLKYWIAQIYKDINSLLITSIACDIQMATCDLCFEVSSDLSSRIFMRPKVKPDFSLPMPTPCEKAKTQRTCIPNCSS